MIKTTVKGSHKFFKIDNRGSAESELNDENSAIMDYTKAIELKPDYSMAYNNRGWSKFRQKKYSEAMYSFFCNPSLD